MKKNILFIFAALVTLASCVKDRNQPVAGPVVISAGDTLMYYWSFNNQDSSIHTADFSVHGSSAYFKYFASYIDYTGGSNLNLVGTTDSGQCLRVRNPSDSLIFVMPTTGYDSLSMAFAVEASSSGPAIDAISYTTDGINYVTTGLNASSFNVTTSFTEQTFSFIADPATNNNPKFAVKIRFVNNNTGTSGNDRFDNVTLMGVRK